MSQAFEMPATAFERMREAGQMDKLISAKLMPDGMVRGEEVFTGFKVADIKTKMDERRTELEAHGAQNFQRAKIGRNSPCLCGSGLKFKKCCIGKAVIV